MRLKRGTIVKCVKDVISTEGEKAFSEGKYYRTYPWQMPENHKFVTVICAKNDFQERHIIYLPDGSLDNFFQEHFEVIEVH